MSKFNLNDNIYGLLKGKIIKVFENDNLYVVQPDYKKLDVFFACDTDMITSKEKDTIDFLSENNIEVSNQTIKESKEQLLLIIADLGEEIEDLKHQLKLATDKEYRLDWINNKWLPRNGLKNGN